MLKPKIGICTAITKGFNLREEDSAGYQKELIKGCNNLGIDTVAAPDFISTPEIAEETARFFNDNDLDAYILHIGTFIDDPKVMPLVVRMDIPVIIWAHSYSAFNISITGSQNLIPNIYDLGLDYKFIYGKFDDKKALQKLYKYARACALKNMLSRLKIGYFGGGIPT
jgi:L-fucose isomerase-like protein